MTHFPRVQRLMWEIDYTLLGGSPGANVFRYATSTFATDSDDTPPNITVEGRLIDPGNVQRLAFAGFATTGRGSSDYGFIELANQDGDLDFLYDIGWGWPARLLALDDPPRIDTAVTLLEVTAISVESGDALRTIRIRLRDNSFTLDNPLLETRYTGAGGEEGGAALADQFKPRIYGRTWNVPGILIDAANLIYQFCDNAVEFLEPYDGGILLTFAGDNASYAALAAASISAGQYRTCLARGMARFGATPSFLVHAHVAEKSGTNNSASKCIQRIFTEQSISFDSTLFDAFHYWNTGDVGIYVNDEKSISDVIAWLASSVGGSIFADGSEFKVMWVYEPTGAGSAQGETPPEYTINDILTENFVMQIGSSPESEGGGRLVWKVVIKGGKNWHPTTAGELAAAVLGSSVEVNFKSEYLNLAEATDIATQLFNPLAATIEFESALRFDAQPESERLLELYKVRRDRLSVPLSFADDFDMGNVNLGTEVKVLLEVSMVAGIPITRLGYGGFLMPTGKPMLVIGRKDDYRTKVRTLYLWG